MKQQYQTALSSGIAALQAAQNLIQAEIAAYPTPISGCDAQFNHLLSDRARVSKALHVMQHPPFIPTSRQLEPDILA